MNNKITINCCKMLIALMLLMSAFAFERETFAQGTVLPDEVLIKLNSSSDLSGVSSQYGITLLDQFGTRPIYRMRVANGGLLDDTIRNLQGDIRVVYAEPNSVVASPEASGTSWSVGDSWNGGATYRGYISQWFPKLIRLTEANQISTGLGVKVAVLDTGISYNHSLFAGKLLPGWDFVDNDADPSEFPNKEFLPYGHGTHVAGIIARVAPNAQIIPLRVLDPLGRTNAWVLAEALAFAANPDGDLNTPDGADIVNLSLASPIETRLFRDLMRTASNTLPEPSDEDFPQVGKPNLMIVVAGGNNGGEIQMYPSAETSVDGLIAVGSSNSNDIISSFSNYGSWIRVAAPGEQIISATPDGRFGTWSGTSMAAPVVSGVVALIKQRFPGLTPALTKDHIRCTSVRINSRKTKQRVDALNAVTIVPNTGCAE